MINDISEHVKLLYPYLVSIHVNYSIRMGDVQVELPCNIWTLGALPQVSFGDELVDFKRHFSF
jgi:hypothetical protein